ncbi:MAG: 3-phenylpropionate/trans-cinnamate dioxygenase ferredoxin subunit [Verrucomicrobiales bacterium]|jgi:3-phenylpropionate/trans-cinnamate dioxygenase ferredoxin subunit
MPEPISIAKTTDLEEGQGKCFVVNDHKIAVFKSEGEFYAMDDLCTHADAPLSDGWVNKGCVACPWHGAEFDLKTGAAMTPPASSPVKTYPVTIDGEDIRIEM